MIPGRRHASEAGDGGGTPRVRVPCAAMPLVPGASLRAAHYARMADQVRTHLAAGTPPTSICAAPGQPPCSGRRALPSQLQSLMEQGLLWRASACAPREGSLVGQGPMKTPKGASPEGPEPGPEGARPDGASRGMSCLYVDQRCQTACAGCALACAGAAPVHAPARAGAAPGGPDTPPSNTGVNKTRSGQGD